MLNKAMVGKEFTAIITGIECSGKIQSEYNKISSEIEYFLCQNEIDGFSCEDKLGYLYSYWIPESFEDGLYEVNKFEIDVYNLKIKEDGI
jgi:hypothetical protein